MSTPEPASPLQAATDAIRTADIHDAPARLAKAALAAAGFNEMERQLRAVRTLIDIASVNAASYGRGGAGCVSVTDLRAAVAGRPEAPALEPVDHQKALALATKQLTDQFIANAHPDSIVGQIFARSTTPAKSDYSEHLISMAGGDGEPDLAAIQARADKAAEWRKAFHAPQNSVDYSQRDVPALLALVRDQTATIRDQQAKLDLIANQANAAEMLCRMNGADVGLAIVPAGAIRAAITATETSK